MAAERVLHGVHDDHTSTVPERFVPGDASEGMNALLLYLLPADGEP